MIREQEAIKECGSGMVGYVVFGDIQGYFWTSILSFFFSLKLIWRV